MEEDIIQWNCREFGNVNCQKKELLGALDLLDAKEGDLGLSEAKTWEKYSQVSSKASTFSKGDLMETKIEDVVYQGGW